MDGTKFMFIINGTSDQNIHLMNCACLSVCVRSKVVEEREKKREEVGYGGGVYLDWELFIKYEDGNVRYCLVQKSQLPFTDSSA